ncbi:MAG: hypothetical protein ACK5N4_10300 [Parabacteroides gordonii]|uniref:hypothetical protein n=1 Tax=Parabacteroides gordonii TaxID=574930 RepID=UPI003A885EF0
MLNTNEIMPVNQPIDCLAIDKKEEDTAFIDKVNIGMRESAMGVVNSKEEAKQKLSRWLI